MTDREVIEVDEVWAKPADRELLVRIYRRADLDTDLPPVISVHGGAWNHFDRTAGAQYQCAIAAAGFLVLAIDFRQGPDFQHPAASADVVAAVRWLRLHAARLKADVRRIGLLGSSSGGHLALFAGVLPEASFHTGTPIQTGSGFAVQDTLDGHVDYLVALWPVADPYVRYRYARRAGITRLTQAHERFYVDEAAMRAASVPRVVTAGEATHLPPLLLIMPGDDGNVPMDITFDLIRAWQGRHGYLEYVHFPEEPHGFGYKPSVASTRMQTLIINYCRRMSAVTAHEDSA
jgi:acetyl esterase